ncbi:hypothetical protein BCR42DRAFT_56255 [Absidia repens]|uniref:Uncharacterized protein n=1 Tax=Absidia repens TaxID=90262 RepID=A0A1X2IDS3_9FUNG|nr:hypothetical protein BCR42DRAFT_56255 [Absidia repens]
MDWDRIEDLVSQHTQRLVFVDCISFLLDFFETLFTALKDCATVDQCSSLYPRAGPLLTTLATHPYVGCNEKLVSLVIECIMEYTKYSFGPIDLSSDLPKSSAWCLDRLRRISYYSTSSNVLLLSRDLERKVDKLVSNIRQQSTNGHLTITKMEQLSDLSLQLLKDDTTLKVVEGIIDAALTMEQQLRNERMKHDIARWNDNDTSGTSILSDRFIQYVLEDMDNGNGLYQQQWPITLKTKAWQAIPDLFECEWLDWMEKQLNSSSGNIATDRQPSSSSVITIIQHPLPQGLKKRPHLMYLSFTLMTKWIFEADLADWRILGLWIKMVNWHLLQQKSIKSTYEKFQLLGFPGNLAHLLDMMMDTSPSCHVDQLYAEITSFIYGGSPLTLTRRRNQAWLLCLMRPMYNFQCVRFWIGWCTGDSDTWSDMMDQTTMYIAWLVCPSLDERMNSYYYGLKTWIKSLKGFDSHDPLACSIFSKFLDDWYISLNGEVQLGVDILGTMIHQFQSWTTDQYISIINRFLDGANAYGPVTKISVTIPLLERLATFDDPQMDLLISHIRSFYPN